jgi:oxygen-independent coproporphyrinogen-3 oxidase
MFALPGQTLASAKSDVQQALTHQTQHLSYYQLTVEPNTAFHASPPKLPDEDLAMAIQDAGISLIEAAGLHQYEISAYARSGLESRHNTNYWRFGDYLGIGAGAHGKITDMQQQKIVRYAKQRHPRSYMQASDTAARYQSVTTLQHQELPLEFMMNALRLKQGFLLDEFIQRTGLSATVLETPLAECVELGLLHYDREQRRIRASSTGQRFLNDVLQRFY